jgi:hypothetical protein
MKARESGWTQETAAAKGGISVRSGRRIEQGEHRPKRGRAHDWRTRTDPLAEVWESELVPMLERQPQLQALTLLEYLQQQYPGKYGRSVLRTLQRRVQQWRATAGPAKEVMFELEHRPGEMGLSDFTHFKQTQITIGGKPFEHLLYHYRLAYSGWQYVQVVQGGESFIALSEGLQNALTVCGGVPQEHRTDSLSAAYRNLGGRTDADLTQMYERLCQHYQVKPSRNNRGLAHENGSIESPHGHFKNRLHQALLLRESVDFPSVSEYQQFIEQVVERLNQTCWERFEQEKAYLSALPAYRDPDYEVLTVKVSTHSTINIRCITYTVPSRLKGETLTIHLHHDRLLGFVGRVQVIELARIHVPGGNAIRRARSVNYRHVIDSLRLKPRAFLSCIWQQDLLPDDNYRQLWQQMREQLDSYTAARLMTEALYIAAKQDKEHAVATYLEAQLQAKTLTLIGLQHQFRFTTQPEIPILQTQQHSLQDYDQLLSLPTPDECHRVPQSAAQIAPPTPHPQALAGARTPSSPAGLDSCPVLASRVRTRSNPTLPGTGRTGPKRRSATSGKGFLKL